MMIIYLVIINTLAAIGMVAIIYVIDEIQKERKVKRKEKFKQDVLEVINEIMEEEDEL